MSDDWQRRLRDSTDYLNRIDDQKHFHETQTRRSKELSEAILDGDDLKARLALGIGYGDGEEVALEQPPTNEDEFRHARSALRAEIKYSEILPDRFKSEFLERLDTLDLAHTFDAASLLSELTEAYKRVMKQCRPRRDVFDLAVAEEMRWQREGEEALRALRRLSDAVSREFSARIGSALKKLKL